MKISELIIKLKELKDVHGDIHVHYDDNDFHPSEAHYCDYKKSSRMDPLPTRERLGEHILLI